MRSVLLAIALLLSCAVCASAQAGCANPAAMPFTFSNGTIADANEVNANLNVILNCQAITLDVPSLTLTPIGNAVTTLASLAIQTHAAPSASTRQFQVALGMINDTGTGVATPNSERATLFVAMNSVAGGGSGWALNTQTNITALTGGINLGYELDLEPFVAMAATTGPTGIQFPNPVAGNPTYAYGMMVFAGGTFAANAGIVVSGEDNGPGTGLIRGIVTRGRISECALCEYSDAPTSLIAYGTHTDAIDLHNAVYSGNALRLQDGAGGIQYKITAAAVATFAGNIVSGTGDQTIEIKSSGGAAPDWSLQAIASNGRFRIYDNTVGTEMLGLTRSTGNLTIAGTYGAPLQTWANNQTCTAGQITADTNFIYVCTVANVVKRTALTAF